MSEITNNPVTVEQKKSNPALGILGALAGALIGAVLWFVLYQFGFIASIAGIAVIVLACKGYELLSKHLDRKGVLLSILIALLVLLATHFLCWGYAIYDANKEFFEITLMDGILSVPDMVFADGELLFEFIKELLIGLILIAVGAFPYLKKVLHEKKAAADAGSVLS